MVNFICGSKGSGKTKQLINMANKDIEEGNGNIVFVDVDDEHIFSLDYSVRLINAVDFDIESIESFYGFLCGIISMDYDLEKIYVDGIYKIMDINDEQLEKLTKALKKISEKFNTKFYIGLDYVVEEVPESIKEDTIKLVEE